MAGNGHGLYELQTAVEQSAQTMRFRLQRSGDAWYPTSTYETFMQPPTLKGFHVEGGEGDSLDLVPAHLVDEAVSQGWALQRQAVSLADLVSVTPTNVGDSDGARSYASALTSTASACEQWSTLAAGIATTHFPESIQGETQVQLTAEALDLQEEWAARASEIDTGAQAFLRFADSLDKGLTQLRSGQRHLSNAVGTLTDAVIRRQDLTYPSSFKAALASARRLSHEGTQMAVEALNTMILGLDAIIDGHNRLANDLSTSQLESLTDKTPFAAITRAQDITVLMQGYGFSLRAAMLIVQLQASLQRTAKRNNWGTLRLLHEYARIMASCSSAYGDDIKFQGMGNTINESDLRRLLQHYGFADDSITALTHAISSQHSGSSTQTITSKDFAHEMVILAVMTQHTNPALFMLSPRAMIDAAGFGANLSHVGDLTAFEVSFKGDIDSGQDGRNPWSYTDVDFNSDLDALNMFDVAAIAPAESIFHALTSYNDAIVDNSVNRRDVFLGNLGDGDISHGVDVLATVIHSDTLASRLVSGTLKDYVLKVITTPITTDLRFPIVGDVISTPANASSKQDDAGARAFFDYLNRGIRFNVGTTPNPLTSGSLNL